MDKYVLIVAGGKGLRMGGDLPKQFIPMRGKPLLMHTLEAFHRWDASARIILVLPEDHQPYWNMLCKEIGCKVPHAIVKGGDTRFFSVKNGLDWLLAERRRKGEEDSGLSLVAVHDGVRPFVSPEVVEACFDKAAIIIGDQVNPASFGALLAHFENKVMFQGFLWNLNSFDQEGVQLGKVLAKRVLAHETDGALKVFSDLLNI